MSSSSKQHTAFGPLCTDSNRASYIAERKRSNNTAETAALIEALLNLLTLEDHDHLEYFTHYDSKCACKWQQETGSRRLTFTSSLCSRMCTAQSAGKGESSSAGLRGLKSSGQRTGRSSSGQRPHRPSTDRGQIHSARHPPHRRQQNRCRGYTYDLGEGRRLSPESHQHGSGNSFRSKCPQGMKALDFSADPGPDGQCYSCKILGVHRARSHDSEAQ
jgi:hypothetical protein